MVIKVVISNHDKEMINILLRSVYSLNFKIQTEITIYDENEKGFRHCAENLDTDILFIDIDKAGYDFQHIANRVKLFRERTLILYTTSSSLNQISRNLIYAEPFSVIQKNELEASVQKKIMDAIIRISLLSKPFYKYKKNGQIKSVRIEDIMYFSSDNRKINCVMTGGSDSFYGKLDEVELAVASQTVLFSRVSKSFLVNNKYISSMDGDFVVMRDGEEIKVTRNYFSSLL